MAIKRDTAITEAVFSVTMNIVLTGSKRMTPEQQEALMDVDAVRVLICDAGDNDNVLLDTIADAREFSTGSVGYGLSQRGLKFGAWR